jgi:hypothetical protein
MPREAKAKSKAAKPYPPRKPLKERSLECHIPISVSITSLRGGDAEAIATRLWIQGNRLNIRIAHPPPKCFETLASREAPEDESEEPQEEKSLVEEKKVEPDTSTWLTTVFVGVLNKKPAREPYSVIASVDNDDMSVCVMDMGEGYDNHELAVAVRNLCN